MIAQAERDTLVVAARFTPREIEVWSLIGTGLVHKEVGDRLGIVVATVDHHCVGIKEKLRLMGATHAEFVARATAWLLYCVVARPRHHGRAIAEAEQRGGREIVAYLREVAQRGHPIALEAAALAEAAAKVCTARKEGTR
jgi:DNA-binding CsgD family transcriptional regulator